MPSSSQSPSVSPSPSPSPLRSITIAAVGDTMLGHTPTLPPEPASYLGAAGFAVLNNANNHSYHFGAAGIEQTVRALDAAGIQHEGLPDRSRSFTATASAWPSSGSPRTASRPRCSICRARGR